MDVSPKTEVELVRIDLPEAEAAPLLDSGIVPGCFLCRLLTSPSGDPVLSADGICFALRRETARCLRVKPPRRMPVAEAGSSHTDRRRGSRLSRSLTPLIAVVGPPNAGKTTLFNRLTGLRQKVANYPGVTVEKHVGTAELADGRTAELVDLPGVRGLSPRSLDERVTLDVLRGRMKGMRAPDALVVIVDSTRAETDLMLLEPLLEFGLPTIVVLNMADELKARGGSPR